MEYSTRGTLVSQNDVQCLYIYDIEPDFKNIGTSSELQEYKLIRSIEVHSARHKFRANVQSITKPLETIPYRGQI